MTQENNEKGKDKAPLKVGLMVGREWSWPPAFIEKVNSMNAGVSTLR